MTTTNDQLAANATCSFGPKIDIISYHSCDASFMAVHLTTKAAPDCFVEGTSMWPNEHGGFNVHVALSDERALQAAGRTIAAAGLNKVKVTTSENDLRFDVITATQFVLAMYSDALENSGFSVALELDVPNLEAVRRNVSIIKTTLQKQKLSCNTIGKNPLRQKTVNLVSYAQNWWQNAIANDCFFAKNKNVVIKLLKTHFSA